MKKILVLSFAFAGMIFTSCGNHSETPATNTDTTVAGPDSSANNAIIPPSADPGNAGNSSLADTSYHATDSTRK